MSPSNTAKWSSICVGGSRRPSLPFTAVNLTRTRDSSVLSCFNPRGILLWVATMCTIDVRRLYTRASSNFPPSASPSHVGQMLSRRLLTFFPILQICTKAGAGMDPRESEPICVALPSSLFSSSSSTLYVALLIEPNTLASFYAALLHSRYL